MNQQTYPFAIVIRCVGAIVRKRRSRDIHPLIANMGDSHEVHGNLDCTSRHFQCSSRTLPGNRWRTTRGRQDVGALAWHERSGICDLRIGDPKALYRWVAQWSDLLPLTVTPCLEDADAGEV